MRSRVRTMRRFMGAPWISAVVLAAGLSRRMGRSKPLLELNGRTVIEHVLERVRAVEEISPIVVVTGHAGERVAAVVRPQPVQIIYNRNYEKGEMLSSVQAGLRALAGGGGGGQDLGWQQAPGLAGGTFAVWRVVGGL